MANTKKTWSEPIRLICEGVCSDSVCCYSRYEHDEPSENEKEKYTVIILIYTKRLHDAERAERDHCPTKTRHVTCHRVGECTVNTYPPNTVSHACRPPSGKSGGTTAGGLASASTCTLMNAASLEGTSSVGDKRELAVLEESKDEGVGETILSGGRPSMGGGRGAESYVRSRILSTMA